jgi:hypothetical protein
VRIGPEPRSKPNQRLDRAMPRQALDAMLSSKPMQHMCHLAELNPAAQVQYFQEVTACAGNGVRAQFRDATRVCSCKRSVCESYQVRQPSQSQLGAERDRMRVPVSVRGHAPCANARIYGLPLLLRHFHRHSRGLQGHDGNHGGHRIGREARRAGVSERDVAVCAGGD